MPLVSDTTIDQPAFTNAAAINRRIGEDTHLEWIDHEEDGVGDDNITNEAINFAKGEILIYTRGKYSETDLANNRWIQYAAMLIAVAHITSGRNYESPLTCSELTDKRIYDTLKEIGSGELTLPGIDPRDAPAAVNSHVDRRYENPVRVDEATSTLPDGVGHIPFGT